MRRSRKPNIKICELFSGVGGMTLGAARAGFDICGVVDIDAHACRDHTVNFPKTPCWQKNVLHITGNDLVEKFGIEKKEEFGIIGGPPCQGFSVMGQMDRKDPRNRLFGRFFSIVDELQPSFFVAENVPGILHKNYDCLRGNALAVVTKKYDVLPPMLFKASDYGAPTTRTRAFFIGFRKNLYTQLSPDSFQPSAAISPIFVKEALAGLPQYIDPEWQSEMDGWKPVSYNTSSSFSTHLNGRIPQGVGDKETIFRLRSNREVSGCLGTRHAPKILTRYGALAPGECDRISKSIRLRMDGFCPTLRAGTPRERGSYQAIRPIHPTENRVITPREAARLQGFPDWFRFAPDKWHAFMQIGNSVSPILAEFVLKVIQRELNKEKGELYGNE